jgi:molybdopterin-containing oxidoreductase family membrane subunit
MATIGYVALILATALGIWALGVRFSRGLVVTNMTQHVPWGLWIAFYIYFIGLSAGSFLLSTLVYVFGVKRLESIGPLALVQALGCMLLGLVLILVDLGHPERFLNVFWSWNPSSVLAWECLFYTAYVVIILLELYFALRPALARKAAQGGPGRWLYVLLSVGGREPGAAWVQKARRWLKILGIIGIPIAIGVHGGTGAIFAVVKSKPTWYTGLFPIIFLVSALASGAGGLTFLTAVLLSGDRGKKLAILQMLAKLTVGVLMLDLLLTCSEVLVALYGGIPSHVVAWKLTLFGPYWWVFWFIQLGVGALVPIAIVTNRRLFGSVRWLGAAGLLVDVGIVGVRLNIVIPPLIDPSFAGLPDTYHHIRFVTGYFPSLNEWLVTAGVAALGVWVLLIVLKLIPLNLNLEAASDPQEGGLV